jgi:Xaa-Pro aminopeptidase
MYVGPFCRMCPANTHCKPCQVLEARSPVTLRKAIKNETELDGMREAHLRDAVAIVEFLTWLDETASDFPWCCLMRIIVSTSGCMVEKGSRSAACCRLACLQM